ncbi:hypothetical protein NP493_568g01012 [Ridgeia piscesae]|uniref:Uncharacterized protein n=1 Tax=Ridgeia piscesae TaxID=27915 RepID=A0AAD9NPH6_RIDPI|nr:hypothetical protein NP493_568g01012 [Ridgeia piscesae]
MGADTVLDEWTAPEVLRKYFVGGMAGHDREGSPVYVVPMGRLDMKGLVSSAKRADIRKNGCRRIEEMRRDFRKQTEKLGRRVDKVTLVMDMEHFSMRNLLMPGMDVLLQIMAQTEANYPETLKVAFVINAPRIFPLIFKACKFFLSEDTKKKIILLGSNWKERLAEAIDPSELPQHWGGTATDPDGDIYCRSKVGMGGDIPESFYVKPEALVDMDRVTTLVVPRSSSRDVIVEVKEAGKVLRWVFWSEGYDIRFKVSFRRTPSEDAEQLKRDIRVQCHLVPEDDILECSSTGTYILTFDNTYSWLHKKKISYVVDVLDGPDYVDSDPAASISHVTP